DLVGVLLAVAGPVIDELGAHHVVCHQAGRPVHLHRLAGEGEHGVGVGDGGGFGGFVVGAVHDTCDAGRVGGPLGGEGVEPVDAVEQHVGAVGGGAGELPVGAAGERAAAAGQLLVAVDPLQDRCDGGYAGHGVRLRGGCRGRGGGRR